MKSTASFLALAAPFAVFATSAFADDAWDLLAQVEIEEVMTETTYEVRKSFPEKLEAGISDFAITGYVVPLTDGPEAREFILVSDMGFCPFCGSPEHGTSLQVELADATAGLEEGTRITLQGNLEAITDPETFQSVIMKNAKLVQS
ncbi:hypothetical protein [Nereida sp. MMG025]|uniref:hypothetical protein n=1 Tax=Nereida sp. MMG025 TaxID=2909981 RepID=UPI001F3ACC7A|nr:hypothetical protein [Nereida sp. MMG025]MCF6445318.1 hypothetical protein [Nereida sp. MMG025]